MKSDLADGVRVAESHRRQASPPIEKTHPIVDPVPLVQVFDHANLPWPEATCACIVRETSAGSPRRALGRFVERDGFATQNFHQIASHLDTQVRR